MPAASTTRTLARRAAPWLLPVVLIGLVAGLLVGRGADRADDETRVLVVGDSVTQGWVGSCTWRFFFAERLRLRGIEDVDLVGPRTGVYDSLDWDHQGGYADEEFDQDHAARSSAELGDAGGPTGEGIDRLVDDHDPDAVLALWGINDLLHGGASPDDLVASYDEWISLARSADPGIDLVIGQLPQEWLPGVTEVNEKLVELAAERTTAGSPVLVATPDRPFSEEREFTDGIHPDVDGDRRLGTMFESAWWALQGQDPPPLEVPAGDGDEPCPLRAP